MCFCELIILLTACSTASVLRLFTIFIPNEWLWSFFCITTTLNSRPPNLHLLCFSAGFHPFLFSTGWESDLQERRYNRRQSQIRRQIMQISPRARRSILHFSLKSFLPFNVFILFCRSMHLSCSTALGQHFPPPLLYCRTCTVCKDFISIWKLFFRVLFGLFPAISQIHENVYRVFCETETDGNNKQHVRYEVSLITTVCTVLLGTV